MSCSYEERCQALSHFSILQAKEIWAGPGRRLQHVKVFPIPKHASRLWLFAHMSRIANRRPKVHWESQRMVWDCTKVSHLCPHCPSHSVHSVPWYSGMGWTVRAVCCKWDTLVRSQSVHSVPWYIGMGWTVGTGCSKWDTLICTSVRPFRRMVQWDGMDSRDRV